MLPTQVFILYAAEDYDIAKEIHKHLHTAAPKNWQFFIQIEPGQEHSKYLEYAHSAAIVIAMLSADFFDKGLDAVLLKCVGRIYFVYARYCLHKYGARVKLPNPKHPIDSSHWKSKQQPYQIVSNTILRRKTISYYI